MTQNRSKMNLVTSKSVFKGLKFTSTTRILEFLPNEAIFFKFIEMNPAAFILVNIYWKLLHDTDPLVIDAKSYDKVKVKNLRMLRHLYVDNSNLTYD